MQRCADGDDAALGELYSRYCGITLGVATKLLQSRQEAEELVHDLFLEVWQRAAAYDPERGKVRTWILVRLRSRALDRLRSRGRRQRLADEQRKEIGSHPTAPDDPSVAPDRERVRQALVTLPDAQRSVLELAYFSGLTCSEIGAHQDIPVGTVKSRMAAGMRKLSALLSDDVTSS